MLRSTLALTSLFALSLAASAQAQAVAPADAAPAQSGRPNTNGDPWEKLNRTTFLISGAADMFLIRPVAIFYKRVTPRPAREGVHNVIGNLNQPVYFVNQVLQLHPKQAATTLGRFAVNSTVGIGGLFDVASSGGLTEQPTGFGQTLGRYGVAPGPYLFVLGPSSVRETAGQVVDIFLDPINYLRFRDDAYFFGARQGLGIVDARVIADPALKYIQKTAIDPYAALRSAYQQNARFLENGGKIDVKSLPDFGPEPAPGTPGSAPSSANPAPPPAQPQ